MGLPLANDATSQKNLSQQRIDQLTVSSISCAFLEWTDETGHYFFLKYFNDYFRNHFSAVLVRRLIVLETCLCWPFIWQKSLVSKCSFENCR